MNRFSGVLAVFLLTGSQVLAQEREMIETEKDHPIVVKQSHQSRLVFEPPLKGSELAAMQVSDGSSPLSLVFDPNAFQSIRYSRTVLDPETQKLNQKAKEFFIEENKKRQDFFRKIRENPASDETQEDLRRFRQEELARRQQFAIGQELATEKFTCERQNEQRKSGDPKTDCGALVRRRERELKRSACLAAHRSAEECNSI